MLAQLATAATLGLVSGAHCVVMCGPLVAAGCRSRSRPGIDARSGAGYLAGRLASYTALGAVAGAVGHPIVTADWSRPARLTVGALLAAGLLAAAARWLLPRRPRPALAQLARPRRRSWGAAVLRYVPTRGVGLGVVTGVFPCGALGAALLAAASTGSISTGAASMAAFSLASAPALVLAMTLGDRASRWVTARLGRARPALAAVALGLAGWIVLAPWLGPSAGGAHCACEHGAEQR